VLGRQVTLVSKVIKQVDVTMLCHVLADEIPRDIVEKNYLHYEPFTSHGSSLSPAVDAAVAARVGLVEQALRVFRLACDIDLSDSLGSVAGGLHMATMGGIWQAVVHGFAGVRREGERLAIDPHLPTEWAALSLGIVFRGAEARLTLGADSVRVEVRSGPLAARVFGREVDLPVGEHVLVRQSS
jgi:trehalose/maltose hydrolase-like predicted phosphorylase